MRNTSRSSSGPAPGAERAVAFLMPTASYMAYGNDRLAMDGGGAELLNNIVNIIGPQDIFLNEHPEFGGLAVRLAFRWQRHLPFLAAAAAAEHAAETARAAGWFWRLETLAVRG